MSANPAGLRFALEYARRGWSVLPLAPRSKVPAVRGGRGVHDATRDSEQLVRWWTALPSAGVAVACGRPSAGLIVLDVDPRNGGDESLHDLQGLHGGLPPTPRVLTGGGGEHYYFRLPMSELAAVGASLGPGLDVKADGGYVVAPPSIHPSGVRYRWALAALLSATPIAELPRQWLAPALRTTTRKHVSPAMSGQTAAVSFLGDAFAAAGMAGVRLSEGKLAVRCPWLLEHTVETDGSRRGDGNDSSTAILPPTTDALLGAFRCLHAHCATRSTVDVLHALPVHAIEAAVHAHPRAYGALLRRLARRGAQS